MSKLKVLFYLIQAFIVLNDTHGQNHQRSRVAELFEARTKKYEAEIDSLNDVINQLKSRTSPLGPVVSTESPDDPLSSGPFSTDILKRTLSANRALQEQIKRLEDEKEQLTKRIENLINSDPQNGPDQEFVERLRIQLDDANSQLRRCKSLETEIVTLRNSLGSASARIDTLNNRNFRLRENIYDLRWDIRVLNDSISRLDKSIIGLKRDTLRFKSRIRALKRDSIQLELKLSNRDSIIKEQQKKIVSSSDSINKLLNFYVKNLPHFNELNLYRYRKYNNAKPRHKLYALTFEGDTNYLLRFLQGQKNGAQFAIGLINLDNEKGKSITIEEPPSNQEYFYPVIDGTSKQKLRFYFSAKKLRKLKHITVSFKFYYLENNTWVDLGTPGQYFYTQLYETSKKRPEKITKGNPRDPFGKKAWSPK